MKWKREKLPVSSRNQKGSKWNIFNMFVPNRIRRRRKKKTTVQFMLNWIVYKSRRQNIEGKSIGECNIQTMSCDMWIARNVWPSGAVPLQMERYFDFRIRRYALLFFFCNVLFWCELLSSGEWTRVRVI